MLSATRGLAVDPDGILVSRGSQMALALAARALVRPGDAIAVEHPGYRAAWEAFRIAGADIVPVPVDDAGLDVAALRRAIARRPIRAVYVTPHHQFPTTVTMTGPRRLALLQLAVEARFAVIEDDYDHEFHYTGRPVLPLASVDAAGVVIYIGTLSKVFAPGLRLGFVAAPAELVEHLAAYRSIVDLQGDAVLERTVAELLEDGLIQRHVRKVRRIYRARLEALVAALRTHLGLRDRRRLHAGPGPCTGRPSRFRVADRGRTPTGGETPPRRRAGGAITGLNRCAAGHRLADTCPLSGHRMFRNRTSAVASAHAGKGRSGLSRAAAGNGELAARLLSFRPERP